MAPLSDQYHKARKGLGFFGAVLIAWVLIRVDLKGLQASEYLKWLEGIENKEAIPFVFFTLIVYFWWRLYVEWYEDSAENRGRWSRRDFVVSQAIAATAIMLFVLNITFKNANIGLYAVFAIPGFVLATLFWLGVLIVVRGAMKSDLSPEQRFYRIISGCLIVLYSVMSIMLVNFPGLFPILSIRPFDDYIDASRKMHLLVFVLISILFVCYLSFWRNPRAKKSILKAIDLIFGGSSH